MSDSKIPPRRSLRFDRRSNEILDLVQGWWNGPRLPGDLELLVQDAYDAGAASSQVDSEVVAAVSAFDLTCLSCGAKLPAERILGPVEQRCVCGNLWLRVPTGVIAFPDDDAVMEVVDEAASKGEGIYMHGVQVAGRDGGDWPPLNFRWGSGMMDRVDLAELVVRCVNFPLDEAIAALEAAEEKATEFLDAAPFTQGDYIQHGRVLAIRGHIRSALATLRP